MGSKRKRDRWTDRCPARQPLSGLRCGLPKGHPEREHTILIPTGAPWWPKARERGGSDG